MKKRFLALLLSLSLISMVACSTQDTSSNDFSAANSSTELVEGFGAEEPAASNMGLHQVGSIGGAGLNDSSPDGLYEIAYIFDNGANIMYTDYATNTKMFLCARPECTHDNETCQSYIDTSKGNMPGLVWVNSKLLAISPGSSNDFQPTVEIMDPDGSNRHIVAQFKSNQNIGTGQFLADDTHLYFIMEDIKSNGSYTTALHSLNLATGELKNLMDTGPGEFLFDGHGSTLYMKKLIETDQPRPEAFDTIDEWVEAANNSLLHQIIRLDMNDLKSKEVVEEWVHEVWAGRMYGGIFYFYNSTDDTINRRDYSTNELSTVKNTTGYTMDFPDMQKIVGNNLVMEAVIGSTDNDIIVSSFAVDFSASRISEIGLLNNWNRPIYLVGESDGRVFVQYEIVESTYMGEMDGVMTEFTSMELMLGYLDVDDYLNGVPNYHETASVK